MSDANDKELSSNELLDRIAKLESVVAEQQERLSVVSRHLSRWSETFSKFDDLLMDHCKYLDGVLADVVGRLQSVEYKLFPGLAKDIIHLQKLVGEDRDARINPLDKRPPSSPWKGTPPKA